MFSIGTNQLKC